MNEPTPLTDAHIESRFATWDSRTVDADFARKMERANTELHASLNAILDAVDYTRNNCRPVDMVSAVLDPVLIKNARRTLQSA